MDAKVARELLEAEQARLLRVRHGLELERLDELEGESMGDLSPLDQHQADVGSEVFEREKDRSILGRVDADLQDVADALSRIERGRYGTCQTCGATIADERLEAVPATRFCTEHEVLWEGTQMSFAVPADYGDGAPFADDVACREAGRHLEFLPTDDELDEGVDLAPEESALHVTSPERGLDEGELFDEQVRGRMVPPS